MGENEKLIDRIIQELDVCSHKVEDLSVIVTEAVTILKILSKIVFCIVLAIIGGAVALSFDTIKTNAELKALKEVQQVSIEKGK